MEELGALLEPPLSHSTIARIETGVAGLTLDTMQQVAQALRVTPYDIISAKTPPVRFAPVIAEIPAGKWIEAVAVTEEYLPIPTDVAGPRSFLVRVDGKSMADLGDSEGYALVDPDELDLIEGKPYAILNERRETTFNTYASDPPSLVPMSSEPNQKPVIVGRTPFVVIGRVRMVMKRTD
ncbi:repressor LexA [Sphingopyxis flava]|uniref:Repressor LexA n=2 Tax=Sphingopyxis flava TaxID=1507287 RepID=A0A1T5ACS6_9SPHN|nr:repressor LexA [Sphingopyxis flava]